VFACSAGEPPFLFFFFNGGRESPPLVASEMFRAFPPLGFLSPPSAFISGMSNAGDGPLLQFPVLGFSPLRSAPGGLVLDDFRPPRFFFFPTRTLGDALVSPLRGPSPPQDFWAFFFWFFRWRPQGPGVGSTPGGE